MVILGVMQGQYTTPTRFHHWLLQDGCHITVSTDSGLTVYIDLGCGENKHCFNRVLLWIFNFLLFY